MTIVAEPEASKSPVQGELRGPLFVLSVWRSGSSLLYSLLNQHSQIALMYEGDLPRLHRFLRGRFRSGAWRERWEFWNRGPSRHGIPLAAMPENVGDAWEATRLVYREFARRKRATVWGEKTPHWFDCPLQMAEKFPDARFIFLWRDPNAVLKSIATAARTDRFFKKAGFTHRVLLGIENLRHACDTLAADGSLVLEVNYEDLTSNTSDCMRQICAFLELPFEQRTTSLEGADRSAIGSGPHHAMVRGNHVAGQRKSEEVLPSAQRAKISRYICRWERRSHGTWPKYPAERSKDSLPAGPVEVVVDRIIYQGLLWRDKFVALAYALVPVGFARLVRAGLHNHIYKKGLLSTPQ